MPFHGDKSGETTRLLIFYPFFLPNDGTATSQVTSYFFKKKWHPFKQGTISLLCATNWHPWQGWTAGDFEGAGVESVPPRCDPGSSEVLIKGPFPKTNWDTPSQVISFHFHKASFWWASHWKLTMITSSLIIYWYRSSTHPLKMQKSSATEWLEQHILVRIMHSFDLKKFWWILYQKLPLVETLGFHKTQKTSGTNKLQINFHFKKTPHITTWKFKSSPLKSHRAHKGSRRQ